MKVKEFLSDYADPGISYIKYGTVEGSEITGYWRIGKRRVRFIRKSNGDYLIRCPECGHWFTFDVGNQNYYARHGFDMPSRCHKCRDRRIRRI
jgi:uncharacterized C2H2 Zn-finger protein